MSEWDALFQFIFTFWFVVHTIFPALLRPTVFVVAVIVTQLVAIITLE